MNLNFSRPTFSFPKKLFHKKSYSSSQVIIFGFLAVILLGTILLMMPFSSQSGEFTSFLDCLFTATSATCVTGLVVKDTATYWSVFGKTLIIILIQIGGMGVVTMAVALTVLSGRKIGLRQRSLMQDSISAHQVGGIINLTGFILKGSALIELIGAILLYPAFVRDFGPLKGLWYSLWHSISAFCNAGFDLMGVRENFSSLTTYSTNAWINLVIILLIIIGGIGFLVWNDVVVHRFHFKKYRLQSKVALLVSSILIIVPAVIFFFAEFQNPIWSHYNLFEKIQVSIFQSVTMRTAGFNTVDLAAFSGGGTIIMIFLMLIGGSPGSTAGGLKTTTVAVLFANMFSIFRKKNAVNMFGRRISDETIRTASTLIMLYITLFLTGAIMISWADSIPILTALFETASAVGTVGLTLGVTPQLCSFSHIILIVLMFIGRVGGLTIIFAAISTNQTNKAQYPLEKITVG